MKILLTGDWHITDKKPSRRLDENYLNTIMSKLDIISEIYHEEECSYLLQAGDFFDTPSVPLWVLAVMYEWIKKEFDQQPIYTIYGQHDTEYHSDKVHNTPLNMLRLLGGVKISYNTLLTQKIIVRCFSWFDPIPEPAEKNDMKKILVLHKTISNGYTAFESTDAKTLLDRLNYDLILSGDNHKQFTVTSNGRHLVNPGSLMRSAIDQADHEPAVYIYDTEATRIKDALKRIPLKVAPANEVFDLNRFEQEKELDGKAIMFADEITGNLRGGLDFIDGLKTYLESLPLDHMVKDMLKRVTGGRV